MLCCPNCSWLSTTLKNSGVDELPVTNLLTQHWVVPKKIRTPPTEQILVVRRGGGRDCLKNVLNFYRMSRGGGGGGGYCQFPPWGGGVWIFSGTTHCIILLSIILQQVRDFLTV